MKIITIIVSLLTFCLMRPTYSDNTVPSKATDPSTAKNQSPSQTFDPEVKKYIEELFNESKLVNDKNKSIQKKARKKIDNALDWVKLSKKCLGDKIWNAQSPANRNSFTENLKEVVNLAAYSRLDKFWSSGLTYTYKEISSSKNGALVVAVFKQGGDEFVLTYDFVKQGGTLKLIDISVDGDSYSEVIQKKVHAYLFKKGNNFQGLLAQLKERKKQMLDSFTDNNIEKNEKKSTTTDSSNTDSSKSD